MLAKPWRNNFVIYTNDYFRFITTKKKLTAMFSFFYHKIGLPIGCQMFYRICFYTKTFNSFCSKFQKLFSLLHSALQFNASHGWEIQLLNAKLELISSGKKQLYQNVVNIKYSCNCD